MLGAIAMLLSMSLFASTHLILSLPSIRQGLIQSRGIKFFLLSYVALTVISLLTIAFTLWLSKDNPLHNPLVIDSPVIKITLGIFSLLGTLLAIAGVISFPSSPMAVFSRRSRGSISAQQMDVRLPKSLDKYSRHPFFVGFAILMACHMMLSSTLPMLIFFAGFTIVPLLGIKMQDHKLSQAYGSEYRDYIDNTSIFPIKLKHMSPSNSRGAYTKTLIGTAIILVLHPIWISTNGSAFALLAAIGGILLALKQLHRD